MYPAHKCSNASVKMFVYLYKKNIQMFFVKYGFYFIREMKNMYTSFVALPLIKYKYFPLFSLKYILMLNVFE